MICPHISDDCSIKPSEVEADPDIAGIGVRPPFILQFPLLLLTLRVISGHSLVSDNRLDLHHNQHHDHPP